MVKRMVAEGYLMSNIAVGLKTPKAAKRPDRSRLAPRNAGVVRAGMVSSGREGTARVSNLVIFCGLRESEAYGLKNGDLFELGAIRIERSWYKGEVNPTKTNENRDVGVEPEIFERLRGWIGAPPDRSNEGWVFPSERIVNPLLPDNGLRRCVRAWNRWDSIGSTSPCCGGRIQRCTRTEARTPKPSPISGGTAWVFTWRST